jgi:hypothetical protein
MNTYLSVRQRRRVVVGQDRIEWGPCDTFARFALREGEEKTGPTGTKETVRT